MQLVALHRIVNLFESRVFKRVDEHDLAFDVLHDLEQKSGLLLLVEFGPMGGEEIADDPRRVRAGGETVAAGFFEQRQQHAGLLHGVERQGEKQPVVELVVQLHQVAVIAAD